MQPKEDTVVGTYDLVLTVTLDESYGVSLSESFKVFVDDCIIVELNVVEPTTKSFTYDVLLEPTTLIIPHPEATIKPD